MVMSKASPAERKQVKAGTKEKTEAGGTGTNISLYNKLIELRKTVTGLIYDKKGDDFAFISISKVLGSIRSKIDELRLILKEEILDTQNQHTPQGIYCKVKMRFTWIDADYPDQREECLWEGHGIDATERCVGIGGSYAEKNFLLKNLQIPVDKEDPDGKQPGVPDAQNPTSSPPPPAPIPPEDNFEWVDSMCTGLSTDKDWTKTWDIMQASNQFRELDAEGMETVMAKFNTLHQAWLSCQGNLENQ